MYFLSFSQPLSFKKNSKLHARTHTHTQTTHNIHTHTHHTTHAHNIQHTTHTHHTTHNTNTTRKSHTQRTLTYTTHTHTHTTHTQHNTHTHTTQHTHSHTQHTHSQHKIHTHNTTHNTHTHTTLKTEHKTHTLTTHTHSHSQHTTHTTPWINCLRSCQTNFIDQSQLRLKYSKATVRRKKLTGQSRDLQRLRWSSWNSQNLSCWQEPSFGLCLISCFYCLLCFPTKGKHRLIGSLCSPCKCPHFNFWNTSLIFLDTWHKVPNV